MKHKAVKDVCEQLGLTVIGVPATGRKSFLAQFLAGHVYWSISSTDENLLGLPRVVVNGRDTHARSIKEIKFLVQSGQ
jgi:hypothetical protein